MASGLVLAGLLRLRILTLGESVPSVGSRFSERQGSEFGIDIVDSWTR